MITRQDIQALRQKQAKRDAIFDSCDALAAQILETKQRNAALAIRLRVMSAPLGEIIELNGGNNE